MGKKIAVRSEYFTRTQAKGEMAHVKREFANDKNVVDEKLTENNFGTPPERISERYFAAMEAMPTKTKNTLIDSVLVLPVEQFEQVQKDSPDDWRNKIHNAIVSTMSEMENEMGFKPVGYRVHLDEGEKLEDGTVKLNPHAHMLFANVCTKEITLKKTKNVTLKDENDKAIKDPKKPGKYLYARDENGDVLTEEVEIPLQGRSPLSLHQTRGSKSIWARQQDIAAKHLAPLGFERGTSKELTKAKHLKKEEHVKRELARRTAETEAQQAKIDALKTYEREINERIDEYFDLKELENRAILEKDENAFKANLSAVSDAFGLLPVNAQEKELERSREAINGFSDSVQLAMAQDALDARQKAQKNKTTEQPSQSPKTPSFKS
ncbi:hypothetical protein FG314_24825 [Vibrio alginolyticus]|nr:hypothetical protein [Vibrio alginolyticus]EHA1123325.1 hypothetical protein [Vibrio alginolyticus]